MYRFIITIALISALTDRAFTIRYERCDTNYKLNTPIKPKAYSIAITPYFNTGDNRAFTFNGEVDITLTTEAVTKQIKLHSEDLIYDAANITVFNGPNNLNLDAINPLEFDKNYTFAFINLEADLQVGVEYTLQITYQGLIRDDLKGFCRSSYIEKGVKKWLGATHLESTHARKVFPCFDEPGFKATFKLAIDRPVNYKPSLSNMKLQHTVPLANGYVREIFYPTPIMPTYLVAFLVSEFEGVETFFNGTTEEFGVFTRPEAINQTGYALDFGMRVLKALGNYFGIDYYSTDPNLKLDYVALPDFSGAMENWGLIQFKEPFLLYVPEDSTPAFKHQVAKVIAHETTHMWFGNLVTCHWWSDIWLNEGFANYFQDYITALIEPELGSSDRQVTGSVYAAYDVDSTPSAAPISNNDVNSPDQINDHFGTITYQKAGAIIRMMHHLMGDEAFRMGLHIYLETNKFGPGYPEMMYEALETGARNHSALAAYPDTDVAEVMSSWISKAGHPVLHVNVNYEDDTVILTQKRFYTNSTYSSDETYNIPITYTTQRSPNFNNTKPVFIMKNAIHEFTIPNISQDHSWVIFNIQETGFYRVNYDDHLWQMIANALRNDRHQIHYLNRAKIINDLFAFFYADEVKFDRLKDVLEYLPSEDNYSVWYAAIRGFKKLWENYHGSEVQADIKGYILSFLSHAVNSLGYEERSTDDFETLTNRMQVLESSCKLGHESCIEHAVRLFRGLKENGTEISPSLRPVAYCNGLRAGNGDDFDFLRNRMATTNVASEARVIGEILECTSDKEKLKSYKSDLDTALSEIASTLQPKQADFVEVNEHKFVISHK